MTSRLTSLAAALLIAAVGPAAHAAVMTFDNPAPIQIDASGQATYAEAGYTISGNAADFLTIFDGLLGGFDGAAQIHLKIAGGGDFALRSLDYSFYDLSGSGNAGNLILIGLRGGLPVAATMLPLGAAVATFNAGAAWQSVDDVAINGTSGFLLDNVTAVPEPAAWTMMIGGVALLLSRRRLRQRA